MADGKIYITISDERNGGIGNGTDNSTTPTTTKEEDKKRQYLQHQFNDLIKQNATKIVSYSLGNVGYFTGDYQAQRNINTALSLMGKARNIGVAFAVGGVVGGTFTIISEAVDFGLQEHKNIIENRRVNKQIDRLRDISGLNKLTNGSR